MSYKEGVVLLQLIMPWIITAVNVFCRITSSHLTLLTLVPGVVLPTNTPPRDVTSHTPRRVTPTRHTIIVIIVGVRRAGSTGPRIRVVESWFTETLPCFRVTPAIRSQGISNHTLAGFATIVTGIKPVLWEVG